MEKRSRLSRLVDTYGEFFRAVTCVDTEPGDSIPHVTLECGHGIYLCGETLMEAQARSRERRFCSQCVSERMVGQRAAS